MASLAPVAKQQFCDGNGTPLAGGFLYTYIAGTSTPLSTYTDESGDTPNTNPIELDADGRAEVWLGSGAYKFVLKDADLVEIYSVDDITAAGTADDESGWAEHAVTDGQAAANLVGQTVDFATYSSALYDVEIIRGTAYFASGQIAIQNVNGTGRVVEGLFMAEEAHGVTWSLSNSGQVWQLKAALSTGPGSGTIKLSRRLVPA
jgi:hypothetical protein